MVKTHKGEISYTMVRQQLKKIFNLVYGKAQIWLLIWPVVLHMLVSIQLVMKFPAF
jgi:hypothetical protein